MHEVALLLLYVQLDILLYFVVICFYFVVSNFHHLYYNYLKKHRRLCNYGYHGINEDGNKTIGLP